MNRPQRKQIRLLNFDYNEIYTYIETNPQNTANRYNVHVKKEVEFRLPFLCLFVEGVK